VINRIKNLMKYCQLADNWYDCILDYFCILPPGFFTVNMRDGLKLSFPANKKARGQIIEIIANKDYEKKGFSMKNGDIVVDLGANVGVFSVLASRIAKRVYAYEPVDENYACLEKNVKQNNIGNLVPVKKAVYNKEGEMEINISKFSIGNSLFSNDTMVGTQKVKTATLESIMRENCLDRIDFLKMDIEGAEYEVLYSTPDDVFNKIERITMEYHEREDGKKPSEMMEFLKRRGFMALMDRKNSKIYAKRNK